MSKQLTNFNFKSVRAALAANKDGLPVGANVVLGNEPADSLLHALFDAMDSNSKVISAANLTGFDALGGAVPVTPVYAWKRKTVTLELDVPECLATIEGTDVDKALVEAAVMKVVSDFVKYQYIDNFEALGAHDLATISAVQAQSGRGGLGFSFTDEVLAEAVESFRVFLTAALKSAPGANMISTAAKGRFSRSAIARSLGPVDEVFLGKLQGRIDDWALWVNENQSEKAEDFATVYQCWSTGVDKMLKQDSKIDIASII